MRSESRAARGTGSSGRRRPEEVPGSSDIQLRTPTHSAAKGAAAAGPGSPSPARSPRSGRGSSHAAPAGSRGSSARPYRADAPRGSQPERRTPDPHPVSEAVAGPAPTAPARLDSARLSPVQPGAILLSPPGTARRGPSGLSGSSRSLTDGTQPWSRPLSPRSQSSPRLAVRPRPFSHRAQSPRRPCPGSPGSGRLGFPEVGGVFCQVGPALRFSRCRRAAHARSPEGAGSGAAAGPLTIARHVGCGSRRSRAPPWPSVPSGRG